MAGHSLSGGIVNHISESLPQEERLIETHMFQPAINPFIKKLKSLKVPRKNTIYRLKGDVVSMMSKLFYNKNTDDYIIKEIYTIFHKVPNQKAARTSSLKSERLMLASSAPRLRVITSSFTA